MRIGLDIDGVLTDLVDGVKRTYELWFDELYVHDGTWDLHRGTRFDSTRELINWLNSVPNFWADLKPIPGALGGVLDLLNAGHDIVLITNRDYATKDQLDAWLQRYWPKTIPAPKGRPKVANLPVANFVPGDKSIVSCDVYVDDSPHRLAELAAAKPCVVRFDHPWNKGAPGHRVRGWKELVEFIETVQNPAQASWRLRKVDEAMEGSA